MLKSRNTVRTAVARGARIAALAGAACLALSGCSSADSNLQSYIQRVNSQPGGGVEPLPEIKPYQTYVYADQDLRSPFVPSQAVGMNSVRPDSNRPRQYLEQFSLDTLKMVGTLDIGGTMYGLVQTKDGEVHRVTVGNYMGESDGRITSITPSKIDLIEIVPNGLGGYMKQPAALGLE